MLEKIKETLEEITVDLNDDKPQLRQDFITFKCKEFDALMEAEKILRSKFGIVVGKSRVIGLVCRLLAKSIEEIEKNKSDGK